MAKGDLVVDITARDRASKAFDKVAGSASKSSRALNASAKVAGLGLLAGGAAAVAFGKSAVASASDAQQSLGATQTVFGKYADTVISRSKKAAEAYGLSANQFRESSNLIGSLLKNQGVAQDKLAGKTEGIVKLGADLSATFGGSAKDAVEALGSAFKGEFDPLERYGVSLKQSTINTKAYALANVSGQSAFSKLSVAQQRSFTQQATMAILMKQTKDAQGQFAAQTDTLAEKQQIAAAKSENLKATLGTLLLPVITQVISAFASLTTWVAANQRTVGIAAAAVIGFAAAIITINAVVKVWAAVTRAYTAAQIALNFALSANPIGLVVVAIAALVVGLVIAYKKSETFRNIVNKAFSAVLGAARTAFGWIRNNWPLLLAILTGPIGLAVLVIVKHWDAIKNAAKNALNKVVSFFTGLPGRITGALGDLSGLLKHAGEQIIESLLAPLRAGADKVRGVLQGITNKIPDWKGPHERDKVLLTPAGIAIMQGLVNGLKKGYNPVKTFLQSVTDKIKSTGQKVQDLLSARSDFAHGFTSFASSIFGRDPGQDANGNAIPESVAGIKAFAAQQRANADALAANVQRLTKLGLSKSLITQLQAQGSSGLAQINALAATATKADIAFLNNQDKATTASNLRAGFIAGDAVFGSDIAQAKRDNAAAVAIGREVRSALHDALNGQVLAEVDGDKLVLVIQRNRKKKGKRDPFS